MQTKSFSLSKDRLVLFWCFFAVLAILSGFADITHFQNLPELFIGHADQANTANVARNIAEGKGAATDSIWLLTNGGLKGNAIPQPESYWSIYVAFIISIFFRLLSSNLTSMLLPAVLTKIAIAALSSHITLRLNKSTLAASATAIFLLFHPAMTERVNGLSDIYLTLCVLVACMLLISSILTKSWIKFFALGLVIGVAIGVKPSGGLLVGLLLAYLVFYGDFLKSAAHVCFAAAGIIIGLAPVLYHNHKEFGTYVSPAYALVSEAARIRYITDDHDRAFYDPVPFTASTALPASANAKKSQTFTNFSLFIQSLQSGTVIPGWQLPFIFLSVILTIRKIKSFHFLQDGRYEYQFTYIAILMLIGGLFLGLVVHTEIRYWNFLIPLSIIMTVNIMSNISKYLPLFVIATSIFSFTIAQRYYIATPIPKGYIQVRSVLPADAVVLSPDPWEFAFHTQRKAVALPYTNNLDVLRSISERYNASYIVIVDKKIRHTFYKSFIDGNFPSFVTPIFHDENLTIAKFNWK